MRRGESEGKEETALERTSWLQDLKYIFSVKSFVLNAVGELRNFEFISTILVSQVSPVSPSRLALSPTLPRFTLRLGSSPLGKVVLATMRTSNPLTKTLSTLSLEQSLPRQVGILSFEQVLAETLSNPQGLGGVLSGMLLSCYLRPKFEWIDPFICGASLLIR